MTMTTDQYWRLVDTWRGNLAVIDECILWLRLDREGKAQAHVPTRLRLYREALRRSSNAAEQIGDDSLWVLPRDFSEH